MKLEPSSFLYMRGVRKTLSVFSDLSTAHLLQGVFPTVWLGGSSLERLSSHLSGAWSMVVGTCVLQPWPTADVSFCAFITPSHEGAKAMIKLEKLNSPQLLQGGKKELVSSPHPETG